MGSYYRAGKTMLYSVDVDIDVIPYGWHTSSNEAYASKREGMGHLKRRLICFVRGHNWQGSYGAGNCEHESFQVCIRCGMLIFRRTGQHSHLRDGQIVKIL